MRVGMLTGGGDCPGLNPCIRAVVMGCLDFGWEVWGIREGWKGLLSGEAAALGLEEVEDLIRQGGTALGTSRTDPMKTEQDRQRLLANLEALELEALVAVGGDDTLGVAARLHDQGVKVVGVPKTMDNDIACTDYTFGFDSAVGVGVEACDRLVDTARSHRRVIVLEVMGREAGWVALSCALGGGADWVLIPEVPANIEEMCEHLKALRARGKRHALVVVSEGADLEVGESEALSVDAFGHVLLKERGVGEFLAKEIQARTGFETRAAVLGHVMRGGAPSAFDRWLATRMGLKAAEMVRDGHFGQMPSLQGTHIGMAKLADAVGESKRVPRELYEEVKALFR